MMINNSWNLTGDAAAYKKNQKGWADAPTKANTFVGEPHAGYQQGKTSVKMIAQRSGMVSSDNPLSTTTKYYANEYDSKRKAPSVANYSKNFGEGTRTNYLRTGVESKNNPLS